MNCKEPYRATQLWNEVIRAFHCGMPRKKHRRKIQSYFDCFTASDAVTWLHCYLMNNPNFGIDVTRQQTINLLGKFLKCHVIETVSNKSKKTEFADNSQLYRFTQVSPQKLNVLRLIQSPMPERRKLDLEKPSICKSSQVMNKPTHSSQKENIPECLFVERKMTLAELGEIWKTVSLERLQNRLPDISIADTLNEKLINGLAVKHNICRISKTGVVSLIDKTDDIPHWVISAMKCLANWPNASGSGSCLPNYPGFEKDVFKVVRDFFINPQVPLIPTFLSSAMFNIFCYFLQDQLKPISENSSVSPKDVICSPLVSHTFPASSIEIKTSTPNLNCIDVDEKYISENHTLPENSHGKILLDDPDAMWEYSSAVFYETDFGSSDPVTKVVSSHDNSSTIIYDPLRGSLESLSTISVCSVNPNPDCNSNENQTETVPTQSWNLDSYIGNEKNIVSQSLQLQTNTSHEHCVRQNHSMFDYLSLPFVDKDSLNNSTCSSKTLTEEDNEVTLHSLKENKDFPISEVENEEAPSAIVNERRFSPSSRSISENSYIGKSLKQFEGLFYPTQLKSSFQLLLLFLHPPNRRQLHLLFRVISKILRNNKFVLDIKMPMRDYLLKTFLPAIVQSDSNQHIMLGMVSYLLDNCEAVFTPPPGLRIEVEEACKMRNSKIVYSVDDACYLTYCEMVSKQQYEEQKVSASNEALKSLFSSILQNQNISQKEKKKRIKQFKENHPDVYHEMFLGKPSMQRSKSSFLNKLINLRM